MPRYRVEIEEKRIKHYERVVQALDANDAFTDTLYVHGINVNDVKTVRINRFKEKES